MSRKEAYRKGATFWITLVTSVGLIVAGFCVPPMGIIDGSILKGVGLLLGFATLSQIPIMIEVAGYFRMTKGDLTIEAAKRGHHPGPPPMPEPEEGGEE